MKKNRNYRRDGELRRLQDQIEKNIKKVGKEETKLTEKNIKRINKEITILENKIKKT